jgi:unsaturated rhamnogalacturonyl hydrolase
MFKLGISVRKYAILLMVLITCPEVYCNSYIKNFPVPTPGLNELRYSNLSYQDSGPDWSVETANMIINTRLTDMNWDYTVGLLLEGVLRVYKRTHDQRYLNFINEWAQYHIAADGTINAHANSLDNIMPGFTILHLYRETGIERFRLAAEKLRDRFDTYPRTPDGGFWHMTDLEGELWLDGLYMGMPFLTTYGQMIGDADYAYSEAIKQFKLHIDYLMDDETGLLLHAFDYDGSASWALAPDNRSPYAWGRAIGWVMMGLSEILDIIPADFPGRDDIVVQYVTVLESLASYQNTSTGLWYQVVDYPDDPDNWLETSCSMMFVFSMQRAIQKGFLNASYQSNVNLGYNGILTKISEDAAKMVSLTDISAGTSVSADIQYYYERPRKTNDNHGLGTFLIMNELVKYDNLPWLGSGKSLSVAPSNLTVNSASGSTGIFNITSNTTWNVTDNASWLSLSSASGTGTGTLTVTTSGANTSLSARSANVTFSATGVTSVMVTVTQSGASPALSVAPASLTVTSASGSTGSFNVTSNTTWNVTDNASWLSLSTASGTGNGTLTVTTSGANTSLSSRSANVTFSASGVTSVTVSVTQSGAEPELPVLTTISVSEITSTTAVSGGNIISDGGSSIITRGVCWNTDENPLIILNTKTTNGTGSGIYSSNISGLTPGTTYFVRAYATNSVGTGYGEQVTFRSEINTNSNQIQFQKIKIFPNPVSGILTIEYYDDNFKSINILDSRGIILRKEKAITPSQQIDFSEYEQGFYILEFVSANGEFKRVKLVNQ